jgi:hypothetical protein
MALEGIFAKINPFKINDLQTSVFLHNQVNSRLSWYDFFLPLIRVLNNFSYPGMTFFCRHPGMTFFFAYKKKGKKFFDLESLDRE